MQMNQYEQAMNQNERNNLTLRLLQIQKTYYNFAIEIYTNLKPKQCHWPPKYNLSAQCATLTH